MTASALRPSLLLKALTLWIVAGSLTQLLAKAPEAASNGTVAYTWVGYPNNNANAAPKFAPVSNDQSNWLEWRTYRITWQDNATDEEGYVVSIRAGTGGSFSPLANLNPNSNTYQVSVGSMPVGTRVQFKVEAWKHNGTATETSTPLIITTNVPERPVGIPDFSPPAGVAPAATATVSPITGITGGQVTAVNLASGGSGYLTAPTITFSAPQGSHKAPKVTATATTAITNGSISSITITQPGSGYTEPPTITLQSPPVMAPAMFDLNPSAEVTDPADGIIQLQWSDNSTTELGFPVRMREVKVGATDNDWINIGNFPFNTGATSSALLSNNFLGTNNFGVQSRLQFVPGKTYEFQVRAERGDEISNATSGSITIPDLKAPTNLNATSLSETSLQLTWADNSTNESGYEIDYRQIESGSNPPFQNLGSVGENINTVTAPLPQNVTIEFRVRAVYSYTPSGSTTATNLYSAYSANTAQASTTTFAAPTGLTATLDPGMSGTVLLNWTDNSTTEGGFDILAKVTGTADSTYKFARAVRANVTSVSVNSIASTVDISGRPISTNFTPLVPGTSYDFIVRAVGNTESIFSVSSAASTATPRPGFTMQRLYHPAQVGSPFNYLVSTTAAATRTALTVGNLPAGLTLNSSTGLISGTPTVSGLFVCPLSATFSTGVTATANLTLRVLGTLGLPALSHAIPDITVAPNASAIVDLSQHFSDSDAETAVRLETNRGNIDLMLFPSLAPQAVANYLAYVNAGDFDGVVFHRSVTDFVLQAGSLRAVSAPRTFSSVGKRPSPLNEPGVSNLRGTISAAKLGGRTSIFSNGGFDIPRDESYGYVGLPNSATTDFFLNLSDNSSNLDNQNGGFTAFGRMSAPSLVIMDQIGSLPKGNYLDNNTTSTYDASLDKRLIVDGAGVGYENFPMIARAAPADMDINKTIRINKASVIPTLTYTVDAVSTDKASVVVENGQLRITGLVAGTRLVTVTARDFDGNTLSQPFTVNVTPGFQAPAITKQPVSLTVNAGSKAAFSVTATGTGISYQWRRGGVNITDKTAPTLTLENVQAGNSGVYDVVITAGGRSVISSPATLTVRVPADITSTLPSELLVDVGQPLDLSVNATGAPTPTFTWRRGSTVIKGQTTNRLLISSTTLADAGIYKGTATNGSSDTTNACNVLVVDKSTRIVVAAPGKPIKLTAPAAGPFVSYSWRKGGETISQPGFSGVETATLSIAAAQFGTDSADYTCVLTPPGSLPVTITGIVHLSVSNIPQLGTLAPPVGFIGGSYLYTLPYTASDSNRPTSFAVTGLPPGLTLDTKTGIISGRPTLAGTYAITAKASNPAGTSTAVIGSIRIRPPNYAATGTYVGIVNPGLSINDNKGGRIDLTITDNTRFTAKLQLGKDTYNLNGNFTIAASIVSGNLIYGSNHLFVSKSGKNLRLIYEVDPDNGNVVGAVTDGSSSVEIFGYRQVWNAARNVCFFSGLAANTKGPIYNLGLTLDQEHQSNQSVPQGDGYLTLKVSPAGIGSVTGKLADGSSVIGSAIVGETGQYVLFQMLYNNTGALLSRMGATQARSGNTAQSLLSLNSINGSARWIKDRQPVSERRYQAGFEPVDLQVRGWEYKAPKAEITPIVMNLPAATGANFNAMLDFNKGGLDTASRNPDITFRLNNSNLADFTGVLNPATVTLRVTPSTGAYTGTFQLEDSGIKRPVTFQGLIIPAISEVIGFPSVTFTNLNVALAAQLGVAPTAAYGAGHFILDQLPVAPAAKSTTQLSGSARLQQPPLTLVVNRVVTNPVTVSGPVNPGANVTYNLTVSGGLENPPTAELTSPPAGISVSSSFTDTYQWRKNGEHISGATTSTLTLSNVQEAAEGTYDCVVKRAVTIKTTSTTLVNSVLTSTHTSKTFTNISVAVSPAQELLINDPVSNVFITLNPVKNTLATGESVTLTAEADGTAPFTYQWRLNGTNITGATASTYTIPAMGNEHAGNYTVMVFNGTSGTGVLSLTKTLGHATPVTSVTASRTPSNTKIAGGGSVTFSAVSNGSEPRSYQWLKNGIPITAANGATYTINSAASADDGLYKVNVSNGVTTSPVSSNDVLLSVSQSLTNISITPSFAGQAAPINTTVTLIVGVTGTAPYSYQWRKNGTPIPTATAISLSIETGPTANLDTPDVYDVLVSNAETPEGVLSQPFPLKVAEPVTTVSVTRSPSSGAVAPGTTVTYTATANGSGLSYQWRKNGQDISGATSTTYTISNVTQADAASYIVMVSNPVNPSGVSSPEIILSIMDPVSSASLVLNSPATNTVTPGAPLSFSVSASGGSGHTYQWRLNGVDIPGATGSTYETTAPSTPTPTVFDVRAFNEATPDGVLSNSITITLSQ